MPLSLAFDKVNRGVIGCFVKEETMFVHSADNIISIRLNSDSTRVKYGESYKSIEATLCDVYIYRKDGKRTKSVGQFAYSGGGGVTNGAASGLSNVRQQDYVVYYVAACVSHVASKLLQNAVEKTSGESGLGEEAFQQFIRTFWSAQESLEENFELEWNSAKPGMPAGCVLDLDSEARIGALTAYLAVVEANEIRLKLQKPLLMRWCHVNVCSMQVMARY